MALGRLRQENGKVQVSSSCIVPDQPGLCSINPGLYFAVWGTSSLHDYRGGHRLREEAVPQALLVVGGAEETENTFFKSHIYLFFVPTFIMDPFPLNSYGYFCIHSNLQLVC